MKSVYNLLIILIILTLVAVASNGYLIGLSFFISGASIIAIGGYVNGVLTSKI